MDAQETDWGALYADCVDAIVGVARTLDSEQLSRIVPATPDWTVHDLLAHAAGGASDSVTGRMEGAPSPEWTARHVAERADASVAELIEELQTTLPVVAQQAREAERPAVVWDKAVHLADLHEALGLGAPAAGLWEPVLEQLAAWKLAALPLTVHAGGATHGAAGPEVTVSKYELFRALSSRRSRAQMRAWAGSTPSDEQLDALPLFGPREDDQPQP